LASPDDLTVCTPSNQLPDESIPGYQIIQEIHRGGQGVVYQAIQKSTKRRVAIKVMREGPFAGPHERSRFEREVQILAALQHPHIVAVHDSGVASGNFYFAMDYISGDALDRYVEQHDLSVEDALRLFAKVCEAMNAAHLRGIIHRDLKPANIRVDAEGEPHILDFGLARVGLGGLTADSRPQLMTMTGDFVGSPPWAAPEQAEGLPHLIDVRTDVYALGVILFQVLTGEFPYDVTGSILDVLERVRHAEPLRPSTLRRGIGDEVETIILKCLAKDRERRYQSAGEVARDINRYLAGEPIEAKRDSAVYVLKKALRRYRIPVAVATAFVALLAVSLVISVSLWYRAQRDFRQAEEARQIADAKTREAQASALAAEASTREAKRQLYKHLMMLAEDALATDTSTLKSFLEQCPIELRGWEWYRLARLADRSRMSIDAHQASLVALALSSDGLLLASIGDGPTLRLWDAQTGALLRELERLDERGRSVAFSTTGNRLAFCTSGPHGGALEVWDTSTWQPIWARSLDSAPVHVLFSPDRQNLAIGDQFGAISLRNSDTGEELRKLLGHGHTINKLAYSGTGRWLASTSWDCTARIWDTSTGKQLHVLPGHEARVFAVAFSPDAQRLASAGEDNNIHIWDSETARELLVLPGHALAVNALAFSPDGARLCSGSRDATVRLWDAATGDELSVLRGHDKSVIEVAFTPDGRSLVSGGRDRRIKFWDSAPVADERVIYVPEGGISNLAFSANSEQLLAKVRGALCVWNATSGKRLEMTGNEFHPGYYSRDHRLHMRFDATGTLFIDDTSANEVAIIQHEDHAVGVAEFSPDGSRVATRCVCGMLQTWDSRLGKLLRSVQTDSRWATYSEDMNLAYSPDGRRIATCGKNPAVRMWDAETLQPLTLAFDHPNTATDVAFSPDGRRAVTVGWNDVRVWDAETGELLTAFGESQQGIYSEVAFSPNGRSVAASVPGVIKIWDAADPRIFKTPTDSTNTP